MRHNHLRDTVAEKLKEMCFDVQTEPHLIPVGPGDLTLAHSNKEPNARLDVSGRGIWSPFDRSFVDIKLHLHRRLLAARINILPFSQIA